MSKINNPLFDRKSVPRHHRFLSLGKPRDANRWYSASLVMPIGGTRGGFFYPTLTLVLDPLLFHTNDTGVVLLLHSIGPEINN